MIKGIGHLGIVVENIEKSLEALSKIIDFQPPVIKEFPDDKIRCALVDLNGLVLEFLQDDSDTGFLGKHRRAHGDSIHHFCLLSDSIENDVRGLIQDGVEMMAPKPRTGLRGKKIAMTVPGVLNGITVEISEP